MEIDKFGRSRVTFSANANAAAISQLYSKIMDIRNKLEEKHLNDLAIQPENDDVRIKNIVADNTSLEKDAVNIEFMKKFVKEFVQAQLEPLKDKISKLEADLITLTASLDLIVKINRLLVKKGINDNK